MTKKEMQFTNDLISLFDKHNIAMMQGRGCISFISDNDEINIDLHGYIDADSLRVIKKSNMKKVMNENPEVQ